MKRFLALLVVFSLVLSMIGCSKKKESEEYPSPSPAPIVTVGPEDSGYLDCMEDLVYSETLASLHSDEYLITDVHATYYSQEYIDEVTFNSQSNIYFGYTLSELDQAFQGSRYVFTLGEDGQTKVQEMPAFKDTAVQDIALKAAIGSGVLFVCVIAIPIAQAASAPAIAAILTFAAKSGAAAASTGAIAGGLTSGIIRGYQTGDVGQALKTGIQSAASGFVGGAIIGTLGGAAAKTTSLKALTKNGLTMNEAATIQASSGYPSDVIAQFHSMDEYEVYKNAGLKPQVVNNKIALVQDIDLKYVAHQPDGTELTNLQRMQNGKPPIDPASGKSFELHHINQKNDGTLAVLKADQHRFNDNKGILHTHPNSDSEIARKEFETIKANFWKDMARQLS